MPSVKQLKAQESTLNIIGDFFSAYQKLTIYQMQKNRDSTINSRHFFQGLLGTFVDLKQDLKRLINTKKDGKTITFSTLTKNGKSVDVFISFETKFSTEINRKSLEFFKDKVMHNNNDIVIVGSTAKKLFIDYFPKDTKFKFFELKEKNADLRSNIGLMKYLLKYEQINVFNPYYVSLLKQEPQLETISGDLSVQNEQKENQEKKHFLFEPGKKTILHFFEIQIMSNLFQHKIKEAHLANLGSRISTLQNTQNNLEEKLRKVKNLKIKTMKYKANKKQRNRLSGMRFWS